MKDSKQQQVSPGQITGFYKLKDTRRQCIDCIDGWCQMNCGPEIGVPQGQHRELSDIERSEYPTKDPTNER